MSADGGETWTAATLREGSEQPLTRAWAWTFWEADVPLPPDAADRGHAELVCKATDASYNVQPEAIKGIWCGRGQSRRADPAERWRGRRVISGVRSGPCVSADLSVRAAQELERAQHERLAQGEGGCAAQRRDRRMTGMRQP